MCIDGRVALGRCDQVSEASFADTPVSYKVVVFFSNLTLMEHILDRRNCSIRVRCKCRFLAGEHKHCIIMFTLAFDSLNSVANWYSAICT